MKKRFSCSISLMLVFVMLLVSCGNAETTAYLGISDYIINSDEVLRLNAVTPQANLDALKVGDSVSIGVYDLNNNVEDGKEAIKWTVLSIENGKALIISDICIDARLYNEMKEDVTWETSDMREWLNGFFYTTSFDETEKEYIFLSNVENNDSTAHSTDGGADTQDNVFLLSLDEVEKYFENDEARIAKASATAVSNGGLCFDSRTKSEILTSGVSDDYMALTWWLRSPGNTEEMAATVHYFGKPDIMGLRADLAVKGVRPAMWVRTTNEIPSEKVFTNADWADIEVGDKVSFGTYEQNGEASATEKLIWIVLDVKDGKAMLITESVIDVVPYFDFVYSTEKNAGSIAWDESDLRNWLNVKFKTAFSESELGYMVESTLINFAHELTGAGGCADTTDLVYILSSEEVKTLIPNALDRKAKPTIYAESKGVYVDAQTGCADWWLRDSGETASQAKNVLYYGGIDSVGKIVKSDYVGIRPVITVDIAK